MGDMDGYKVVAADIRSAAGEMESAASGVSGADPGRDVADVASALPGSASAQAAAKLVTEWTTRFTTWHDDAVDYSDRLKKNAANYDESDYRADTQLRLLMRRTGELR